MKNFTPPRYKLGVWAIAKAINEHISNNTVLHWPTVELKIAATNRSELRVVEIAKREWRDGDEYLALLVDPNRTIDDQPRLELTLNQRGLEALLRQCEIELHDVYVRNGVQRN